MIDNTILEHIGHFGKVHGLNGEINLLLDVDITLEDLSCIILDMDGINVPFFFKSIRNRGIDSYLVSLDGIDSDYDASQLVNKSVSALKEELPEIESTPEDGFYAEDLIGFKVEINDIAKGEIVDVDDGTENVLFIIRTDEGRQLYIPVADEFIQSIDTESRNMILQVPEGILEL